MNPKDDWYWYPSEPKKQEGYRITYILKKTEILQLRTLGLIE